MWLEKRLTVNSLTLNIVYHLKFKRVQSYMYTVALQIHLQSEPDQNILTKELFNLFIILSTVFTQLMPLLIGHVQN